MPRHSGQDGNFSWECGLSPASHFKRVGREASPIRTVGMLSSAKEGQGAKASKNPEFTQERSPHFQPTAYPVDPFLLSSMRDFTPFLKTR
nr:hypothetical protein [uncultured bacterium]